MAAVSPSRRNGTFEYMDRMKSLILIVFLLFFSSAFPQQGSTGKTAPQHTSKPATSVAKKASSPASAPTLLPGTIEIDAALQRTFGYDPGMTWKILDIRESAIPGIA